MKLTRILCVLSSVALLAAAGCKKDEKKDGKGKAPTAGKTTTKTPPKTPDKPETKWTSADTLKVWTDCGKAWNEHDATKMANCYADDANFTMVDWQGLGPSGKGKDNIMKNSENYWKGFPDIKGTSQLVLVNGPHAAAISLDEGTNSGDTDMMPATNKKVSLFSAMLTKLNKDGKVSDQWVLSDQATWAHQMGMAKNPMAPDSEKAWGETVTVTANDKDKAKIDANVAVIKNFEKATAAKDMDTLKAHITDDVSFRYVPMAKPVEGAEAYMAGMTQWGAGFESMTRNVKDIWGAGDWVVAVIEHKAKMGKELPKEMAKAAGKDVATTQIAFYKVTDSKVAAHWVFENSYAFAIQAGLAELPKKMDAPADKGAKDAKAPAKGKKGK